MSENMQFLQDASQLVSKMISLVKEYERGTLIGDSGFTVTLTPTQITELKTEFVAKRTECEDLLNSVAG